MILNLLNQTHSRALIHPYRRTSIRHLAVSGSSSVNTVAVTPHSDQASRRMPATQSNKTKFKHEGETRLLAWM